MAALEGLTCWASIPKLFNADMPLHEAIGATTATSYRTSPNHLSEKADLKVVRDHLGHANINTTSSYLHSAVDARHDATAAGHSIGWRTSSFHGRP